MVKISADSTWGADFTRLPESSGTAIVGAGWLINKSSKATDMCSALKNEQELMVRNYALSPQMSRPIVTLQAGVNV